MSRHHCVAFIAAALLSASALAAQNVPEKTGGWENGTTSVQSVAVTDSVAPVGSLHSLRVVDTATTPLPFPPRARTGRNTALMIVGGAGMIVGAVVGGRSGNVIMVGGGVVGLIGLWNYLK